MNYEHPCCGVSTNIEDYFLTRRKFLNRVGMGLGALGLAGQPALDRGTQLARFDDGIRRHPRQGRAEKFFQV